MSADRLSQLEKMALETPEDRELRYFLATEYFALKRYGDSLRELEHYFRSGDDEGVGFKMRGICLFHLGRKEEALAALESGIAAAERHHHSDLAAEIEDTLQELYPET
jgi:tetratricopeptide (TPR) repeat protein